METLSMMGLKYKQDFMWILVIFFPTKPTNNALSKKKKNKKIPQTNTQNPPKQTQQKAPNPQKPCSGHYVQGNTTVWPMQCRLS